MLHITLFWKNLWLAYKSTTFYRALRYSARLLRLLFRLSVTSASCAKTLFLSGLHQPVLEFYLVLLSMASYFLAKRCTYGVPLLDWTKLLKVSRPLGPRRGTRKSVLRRRNGIRARPSKAVIRGGVWHRQRISGCLASSRRYKSELGRDRIDAKRCPERSTAGSRARIAKLVDSMRSEWMTFMPGNCLPYPHADINFLVDQMPAVSRACYFTMQRL